MLTDLRLQNFRSYNDASFETGPGVNIIVGPNASGKTNLLEAILVLAQGNSYRAKDRELVRFDQSWARLDCDLASGTKRLVKIINHPKSEKIYEIDKKILKRISIKHTLPLVLFEPGHLQLITASPERRREFMDNLLKQTTPGYGTLIKQYKRTLAQRNSLLKQQNVPINQFFAWNVRLSQLAGQIVKSRKQLSEVLNKDIKPLYRALSNTKTVIDIKYDNQWPTDNYESMFLKKLEENIAVDKINGYTITGPHREDLLVICNGRPAIEMASRGETRTIVLALKMIELKLVQDYRDMKPILLLDDVYSELDGKRRHALTDFLAPNQAFITTTDADIVLKFFSSKCNVIPLG